MMMDDYDYLFKIVLIGDSGVGKSSILAKVINPLESIINKKSTIGVEFVTKIISTNDKQIKLQIWDTAGQERYRAITNAYYRGAVGIILVYDITKMQTFHNILKWLDEAKNYSEKVNDFTTQILLVGNMADLAHLRAITTEEGKTFAHNNGLQFIETSALTNDNIMDAIDFIGASIYNELKNQSINTFLNLKQKPIILETSLKDDNLPMVKEPIKKSKCC